jgi:sulfatase maturation enzyme AslB (radical SAM superfamily)
MPRVNIYLNSEDFAKWHILVNKSAFVSRALKEQASEYCPHGNIKGYCAKGCGRQTIKNDEDESQPVKKAPHIKEGPKFPPSAASML